MEGHFAFDRHLVGGDAAFEKFVSSCTSWSSINPKGFLEWKTGAIPSASRRRSATYCRYSRMSVGESPLTPRLKTSSANAISQSTASFNCRYSCSDSCRRGPAPECDGVNDFQSKLNVSAFVAETQLVPVARPCSNPRERRK